jgi:hypothetical protein
LLKNGDWQRCPRAVELWGVDSASDSSGFLGSLKNVFFGDRLLRARLGMSAGISGCISEPRPNGVLQQAF